jgi:threonine dehydrogenase-like Zn-dependent dehydrogenase
MRSVVTRPGLGQAWLADLEPPVLVADDDVLVKMLRVGVCGTDRHVIHGGSARNLPPGSDVLVIGHEAVGQVIQTGRGVDHLHPGDLVVPTVRRGCGRCPACLANQADLCFSGGYTERGIVGAHGFLAEHIVEHAGHLVPVPAEIGHVAPLVESLTTPEKALRRIDNARAHLPVPADDLHGVQRALVTGAGPIALLAMLALRLRGIQTVVLARQAPDGPAARLASQTGAEYVELRSVDLNQPARSLGEFDAIIEATGAAEMAVPMLGALARNGVLDLVGGGGGQAVSVPPRLLGGMLGRNLTLLGSVNANPADWQLAVHDLVAMRQAFPGVVEALITHTYAMQDTHVAFERLPGQIKAVVEIT